MRSRWRSGPAVAPWLLVSLFAHAALLSQVARRTWVEPLAEPALPRPPEPLELPLFPTPTSAVLAALVVLLPAATVWMQRRWERRTEPLALAALSLACLGQLAAIGGAVAVAEQGDRAYPVNLVTLGVGLCVASAAVGVAAVVRILLDRARRSGLPLALGAAGCAAFAAWLTAQVLVAGRFPALDPADPELPIASHTRPDRCSAWDPDVAIVRIDERGVIELEGRSVAPGPERARRVQGALAEAAARMTKDEDHLPEGVLCVRADRRAPWDAVAEVLTERARKDVQLWKLHLATRWPEPEVRTSYQVYLPKDIGISCPPPGTYIWPHARLRLLSPGAAYLLDDCAIGGRAALRAGLALVPRERYLRVDVAPGRTWGEVAALLEETTLFFQDYELDGIDLSTE